MYYQPAKKKKKNQFRKLSVRMTPIRNREVKSISFIFFALADTKISVEFTRQLIRNGDL